MHSSVSHRPSRRSERRAGRSRVALLVTLLILAALAEMVGCDSGGGGGGGPTAPQLNWPRLRRANTNGGIGSGGLDDNEAKVTDYYEFNGFESFTPSSAVPILGRDRSVYIAADEGLLSIDSDFVERWFLGEDQCDDQARFFNLETPTVSTDGREIIVASTDPDDPNGGNLFYLREPEDGDDPPECERIFNVGSLSSALTSVDGADFRMLSFVTGTFDGRLTSFTPDGQRRWSYPSGLPFGRELSSAPAVSGGNFVINAPDGRLHSVSPGGSLRWTASTGPIYQDDQEIPAPAVFQDIFTVNADGQLVAFSSGGNRLWTFTADDGARFVGSPSVSALAVEGGGFLGENVVFALDDRGTVYGVGSEDGELVRFCQIDNRACVPSNCNDDAPCVEDGRCEFTLDPCETEEDCIESRGMCVDGRCSLAPGEECDNDDDCQGRQDCLDGFFCTTDTSSQRCTTVDDCCPEGDTQCINDNVCNDRGFCSIRCTDNEGCCAEFPEGDPDRATCLEVRVCNERGFCGERTDTRCVQDLCVDDNLDDSDGLCAREAKQSIIEPGAEIFGSIAMSNDSMVTLVTTDGRLCVRGLDGSIPDGRCSGNDSLCTPDSCGPGDRCCTDPVDCGCDERDLQNCLALGHCINDPNRPCTEDTCDDDEGTCETVWLNHTCRDNGELCTPDSCGVGDSCCDDEDDACAGEDGEGLGKCRGNRALPCNADTCDDGDLCEPVSVEAGPDGCIAFGDFELDEELATEPSGDGTIGEAPVAAAVIDGGGTVIIATEKGIARIE